MTEEVDYFYRRAEDELAMAQRSAIPEAVRAHYTLAGYYLDRVFSTDVGNARYRLVNAKLG